MCIANIASQRNLHLACWNGKWCVNIAIGKLTVMGIPDSRFPIPDLKFDNNN